MKKLLAVILLSLSMATGCEEDFLFLGCEADGDYLVCAVAYQGTVFTGWCEIGEDGACLEPMVVEVEEPLPPGI